MVSSSDPVEFNVDSPVPAEKSAITHRYRVFCTKNNDGSTDYTFEYALRPSVSESLLVGIKRLFTEASEEREELEEGDPLPDKYMPTIPDDVKTSIVDVLDEEIRVSRIRAGSEQEIGECAIKMRLPRQYMIRLDIGREYRDA